MKTRLALGALTLLLAAPAWAGPLLYDGFEYPAGASLDDQVNVQYGLTWKHGGTTVSPTIASGSLDSAAFGMPPAVGNRVAMIGRPATTTANDADRIDIPTAPSAGTLYWSGFIHVDGISTLAPASFLSGLLLGGFNNRPSSNTAVPSTGGALLLIRQSADGLHWNVGTGATTVNTDRVFATGGALDLDPGATAFVVASYTWIDGTNNDLVKLWVNPSPGDLGAAVAPAETVSVAAVNAASEALRADQGGAASFFLRNNASTVGAAETMHFDELRIGLEWADVTPEPSVIGLLSLGMLLLPRRRRA
ncbi:MAG: hypothetical protein HY718_04610 [Planctomycetes bacterium]|nr:hypothetical protein [Planctomycetota bacterium]